MHLVIGMAKSHLDLKGAKREKLELDFLRLVWGKHSQEAAGDTVDAVLLVMTDAIGTFCEKLSVKYGAPGVVNVVVAPQSGQELGRLRDEKRRNVVGMVKGTLGENDGAGSVASAGKEIGERHLRHYVEERFPGARPAPDVRVLPGVSWDYCGVVPTE